MKKFFEKVKLDAKFKTAGEGHRLTEESSRGSTSQQPSNRPPVRNQPISESQANAAIAAIERHEKSKAPTSTKPKKLMPEGPSISRNFQPTPAPAEVKTKTEGYSVEGIRYTSALTGEILPENDLITHYREALLLKLGSQEALNASCTMIYTLNKDHAKIDIAVQTLSKYIDNIIANENEDKYKKIRKENKVFSEKVAAVEGSEEFLSAAGFKMTVIASDGKEELYFVLPGDADLGRLKEAKDCLIAGQPLKSELYRDAKVFRPSDQAMRFHLPNSFYNLTLEEMRREQGLLSEEVELNQQLRTKAMREKPKSSRKYKYALIRIRFPDGFILQGTFSVTEKLSSVRKFVSENLNVDWVPYTLKTSLGKVLDQDGETLVSLSLVPSVVLNLTWLPDVIAQLNEQGMSVSLKTELLKNLQVLS